ncbi:MAG: hypothetical protein IJH04_05965 [Eggerthellaceae bacterium]|nr:hypothetical protein [Eggerthellaceae bacterium]
MRNAVLVSAFLVCAGSAATPSNEATQVRDADEQAVASCQYLQDFDGNSGWGGLAQGAGMDNARNEVREKAAKIGATHLVWINVHGGYSANATAHAYKC